MQAFTVPPVSPGRFDGQNKLKEFLDDPKNKLVYQPTDALDVDLLIDSIVKGATPFETGSR